MYRGEYYGEVDFDGNAYGEGTLTREDGTTIQGTWLKNQNHGY